MSGHPSLCGHMIDALNGVNDINNPGARAVAYVRAGISLRDLSFDEIVRDDLIALSTELARRAGDTPKQREGGPSACDA